MSKLKRTALVATLSAANLLCLLLIPHVDVIGVIVCTVVGFWIHSYSTLNNFQLIDPAGTPEPPSVDSEPWRHADTPGKSAPTK